MEAKCLPSGKVNRWLLLSVVVLLGGWHWGTGVTCAGEETTTIAGAVTTTTQAVTTTEAAEETPVAMFRGNLERTGVYPSGGPTQLNGLVWKFETAGAVTFSPAISGGVVYFGSTDGYLYAVK
jgi:outer membrane protein assembly factor BamB